MHLNVRDLTGQKFGRLTAICAAGKLGKTGNMHWQVRCDCGVVITMCGSSLTAGASRSCGCLRRETARESGKKAKTHGMSKTRTYRIWSGMIQRCSNPKDASWQYYGARGVAVCERWKTFANFLADMGECPKDLTIDRIDSNEGYRPENCRWADILTQARNKSVTRFITHQGKTLCITEWAEHATVELYIFRSRINRGWDIERALTEPVNSQGRRHRDGQGAESSS